MYFKMYSHLSLKRITLRFRRCLKWHRRDLVEKATRVTTQTTRDNTTQHKAARVQHYTTRDNTSTTTQQKTRQRE